MSAHFTYLHMYVQWTPASRIPSRLSGPLYVLYVRRCAESVAHPYKLSSRSAGGWVRRNKSG
jgi:hypothetical protein